MDPRPDFCPGCGAQVYPEEAQCPFCGRRLRSSTLSPVLVGVGGVCAALIAGGLVWWMLDGTPSTQANAPAVPQHVEAAPKAEAPPAQAAAAAPAAGPSSNTFGLQPLTVLPATAFTPPLAGGTPPASSASQGLVPGTMVATAPAAGSAVDEAQTPLPTVSGSAPKVAADAGERRSFAKTTQDRFVENGLDLTVKTSGPDDTTITITFNFPAKTAAELIASGPFPNQCAQRGFKDVLFVDPSGLSWLYDVTTKQLTERK